MTVKGIWRRRSDRRRWLVESLVGLLMLPLSILPIWWYGSHTADGYLMYLRGRYQLLPPGTPGLASADRQAVALARASSAHGVPVLVYHGIGRDFSGGAGEGFVVSRRHFAEQMRALHAAGYEPVTTADLARYLSSGDAGALPRRPVLVTFDDGRFDAMVQADPILAATRMRATMFVIGATARAGSFYYEQSGPLRRYATNGRWDLESHTFDLHHLSDGGPALTTPLPGETLARYRRRIGADLDAETRLLASVTGSRPVALAYPFGAWGGRRPAVAHVLSDLVRSRYRLAFDQDEQSAWRFSLPGDDRFHVHRLEVGDWTGRQLLGRLERGGRLTAAVFAERGLDRVYTPVQLAAAAGPRTCPAPPVEPLRSVATGGRKLVALTFDDGPSPFTAGALDALDRAHAHATFFLVGGQVRGLERLVQRMLVSGDEPAVHTWGYSSAGGSAELDARAQLARSEQAVEQAVPSRPCLARVSPDDGGRLARAARGLGLAGVLWSVDSQDYLDGPPRSIARRVLAAVRPGAIVALHDGGDDERGRTVAALRLILDGLGPRGYRAVTVSQLLAARQAPHPLRLRPQRRLRLAPAPPGTWAAPEPPALPLPVAGTGTRLVPHARRHAVRPRLRLRRLHPRRLPAPVAAAAQPPAPSAPAAAPPPPARETAADVATATPPPAPVQSPPPPAPAPQPPAAPAAQPPAPTPQPPAPQPWQPPGQADKGSVCHKHGRRTC